MRFFGFDSFKGLPELRGEDTATADFEPGQYSCSADLVKRKLKDSGVPLKRIKLIEGWFEDTCNVQILQEYKIKKADENAVR